ncbi:hypothetical protein L6164_012697 [Bauhinia variegata]|uniref:Uncharacterized protein n=1 Tax=Bauhinia variegata TaxID=167791 RepID=A0ACB9PB76_BAUVA|nr:hypothetical protein L6164_012697 [Bauhinia variegata]
MYRHGYFRWRNTEKTQELAKGAWKKLEVSKPESLLCERSSDCSEVMLNNVGVIGPMKLLWSNHKSSSFGNKTNHDGISPVKLLKLRLISLSLRNRDNSPGREP